VRVCRDVIGTVMSFLLWLPMFVIDTIRHTIARAGSRPAFLLAKTHDRAADTRDHDYEDHG
jgi:hypothetical protein